MAAFIKSLSRLLGSSARSAPALYLSAFGKHPGWNDHLDDLGLDTDPLITAKRLLYVQGISQNIDAGAWDKLEQSSQEDRPGTIGRLDLFRHEFLWYMPPLLLAGRLWSSSDGKGRDKYPMVLCAQLTDLPDRFATHIVLPFLAQVHEQCAAATTADQVRQVISTQRETLRSHLKDSLALRPLSPQQLAAVANHPDLRPAPPASPAPPAPAASATLAAPDAPVAPAVPAAPAAEAANAAPENGSGFHRIVYQFVRGLSAFRTPALKNSQPRRAEHLRLPACGMTPHDALLFWLRFALKFLDASTSILLFAPETAPAASAPVNPDASRPEVPASNPTPPAWIDLIAGDPSPANLFCIKAGTKSLPFTSDIPYTLDPSFIRAIDAYIAACASAPESAPLPPWPES